MDTLGGPNMTEVNRRLENGGFIHKEAFCIMEYHCKKCNKSEKIWNARDGVTPFMLGCKCGGEMRHINWHGDKREVEHIPQDGERIFITLPKEIHDIYMRKRIEAMWEQGSYPMKDHFGSKQEAFKRLSETFEQGQPFIMTWGV